MVHTLNLYNDMSSMFQRKRKHNPSLCSQGSELVLLPPCLPPGPSPSPHPHSFWSLSVTKSTLLVSLNFAHILINSPELKLFSILLFECVVS